ncbi:NAD(P)-binding protein [Auricularia subglabra TFB-10046 SS5]|nr:NAD(P)-binding protein [Auricularia subglabra TFB-10046 SS5]
MSAKKSVLITGCTPGGIGHALALEFHSQGLRVFPTARRVETLDDLRAKGMETLALDVTNDESVRAAAERVKELTGGSLDILVNNAGISYGSPATDVDIEQAKQMFDANVFGVMRMVKAFVHLIIAARGKIVNVGSISGVMPYAFGSIYNASKAALHSYGDTLRLELKPFDVDVVTLITGGVTSNIAKNNAGQPLSSDSLYAPISDEIMKRRHGRSQRGAMPATTYARNVVATVLKRRSPAWYWIGNWALTAWIISTFLPRRGFDYFVSEAVGLNILAKMVRQQRKSQ